MKNQNNYGICLKCAKFGTPACPPSAYCLSMAERPFFEEKPKKPLIEKIKEMFR